MELKKYLRDDSVIFDLKGITKDEILKEMSNKMYEIGAINDVNLFYEDIIAREKIAHTSFENGVATPHAKSKQVIKTTILLGVKKDGVDFSNGEEEKAKLIFMIAVPDDNANLHLDILSSIASIMDDENKILNLINSKKYDEVINIFNKKESDKIMKKEKDFIVAVTACPTGIAHTFMARDALQKAADEMGIDIKIETNGTDGRKNEITKEDMKKAKGVILAVNKSVDEARFNGIEMIKVSAKDGISKPKELIQKILDGKGVKANFTDNYTEDNRTQEKTNVYKHLMAGVSYMLPLVISGGILIALAFIFDTLTGNANSGANFGSTSILAKTMMTIGGAAFGLFVPILGGFIAYSIGHKSALTSGLVAGALASQGGSGFLGAIVGALLAGYLVKYLDNFGAKNVSKQFKGIYLILIVPIISVLIVGLLMIFVLNPIVGNINTALVNFLQGMNSSSRIILGLILGAMMAVDMGGPVNKAAYLFGTGTLATTIINGGSSAMAAVMAGGMVPPLAIAIATTVFRNKYSQEEREAGFSNYIMGLSFITEGAIPFAAANPFRVLPACIIGSSIAGALTMLFNIKIPAPHGGILVMFLSSNVFLYLLSVLIGSVVGAFILGILKKN